MRRWGFSAREEKSRLSRSHEPETLLAPPPPPPEHCLFTAAPQRGWMQFVNGWMGKKEGLHGWTDNTSSTVHKHP